MNAYSFDTSALIDGMFRLYRPKNFPSLWHKIDDLIQAERIIATEEVYYEIERKEDRLVDWCKARKKMFVQIDDAIQPVVTQILTDHRNLIKEMGQRSAGDPFVIALAVIRNGVVVTAERPSTSLGRPKIPDVCNAIQVPWMSLNDLIEAEGWVM
jgi:hypothetical protein